METDNTKPIRIYNLLEDEINIDLFNYMQEHGIPDISELLGNNPERLNIGGNNILFVDFSTVENHWILYLNANEKPDRTSTERILRSFFCDDSGELFELRCPVWSEFEDQCIAYRGGKGNLYSIWKYKI